MSVLLVDIPPQYGMLISRKWSVAMGGSLQCDLSFSTFHIGEKDIKFNREPRFIHMIEDNIDNYVTCFLYIDI